MVQLVTRHQESAYNWLLARVGGLLHCRKRKQISEENVDTCKYPFCITPLEKWTATWVKHGQYRTEILFLHYFVTTSFL